MGHETPSLTYARQELYHWATSLTLIRVVHERTHWDERFGRQQRSTNSLQCAHFGTNLLVHLAALSLWLINLSIYPTELSQFLVFGSVLMGSTVHLISTNQCPSSLLNHTLQTSAWDTKQLVTEIVYQLLWYVLSNPRHKSSPVHDVFIAKSTSCSSATFQMGLTQRTQTNLRAVFDLWSFVRILMPWCLLSFPQEKINPTYIMRGCCGQAKTMEDIWCAAPRNVFIVQQEK